MISLTSHISNSSLPCQVAQYKENELGRAHMNYYDYEKTCHPHHWPSAHAPEHATMCKANFCIGLHDNSGNYKGIMKNFYTQSTRFLSGPQRGHFEEMANALHLMWQTLLCKPGE